MGRGARQRSSAYVDPRDIEGCEALLEAHFTQVCSLAQTTGFFVIEYRAFVQTDCCPLAVLNNSTRLWSSSSDTQPLMRPKFSQEPPLTKVADCVYLCVT